MGKNNLIIISFGCFALGCIAGYFLFSPVARLIVPDSYSLVSTEPGDWAIMRMKFLLLWGVLFALFPVVNASFKAKQNRGVLLVLIGLSGIMAAFLGTLYVKQQLGWITHELKDITYPYDSAISMQALRLSWIPLSGIAAMLLMFVVLKRFFISHNRGKTNPVPPDVSIAQGAG